MVGRVTSIHTITTYLWWAGWLPSTPSRHIYGGPGDFHPHHHNISMVGRVTSIHTITTYLWWARWLPSTPSQHIYGGPGDFHSHHHNVSMVGQVTSIHTITTYLWWAGWLPSTPSQHISSWRHVLIPHTYYLPPIPVSHQRSQPALFRHQQSLSVCTCHFCHACSSVYQPNNNNIWCAEHIMLPLIKQFCPASRHFLPLGTKYLQHPVRSLQCTTAHYAPRTSPEYKSTSYIFFLPLHRQTKLHTHTKYQGFLDTKQEKNKFWTERWQPFAEYKVPVKQNSWIKCPALTGCSGN